MKIESRENIPRATSRAIANNTQPHGKVQPAVPAYQRKENNTDLPDQLGTGLQQLSDFSLNDVKVPYNPDRPAQLKAFAYTQGRAQAPTSTNVVQRVLLTKEDVFVDQIKWAAVLGVANIVDEKSGDENGKKLVVLFNSKGIVDQKALEEEYKKKKNQRWFFTQHKTGGLLDKITLGNLQDQGLVMDAVTTVELVSASWDLYKADITEKTGSKKVKGSGGLEDKSLVAVKTRINWADVENEQGKGVTASVLAPDHPLGSPPTNKKINQKVKELSTAAGQKPYIAGHLLNNNLGGPGNDEKNLTAIPKDVNSEMSTQVENEVIERVNKHHEVVYYKVTVEYGTDQAANHLSYASKLSVEFGSYKKNVADFKNATLPGDLEEKHTYVIPIHSPSKYKGGNGYTREGGKEKYTYTDEKGGKHEWTPAVRSKDPAKLGFEKEKNIILKNTTQIKLEFISFAIYALKIKELKAEVTGLLEKLKSKDVEADDLKLKYAALGEAAKKVALLQEQIENLKKEFNEEKKEMLEVHASLESEITMMDEKITHLERELVENAAETQKLRQGLFDYMTKARERAEPFGFTIGFEDGINGRERSVKEQILKRRVSEISANPFIEGYNRGYAEGEEKVKDKKEISELRSENEELKKGSEIKDEEIRKLQEMVRMLQEQHAQKTEGRASRSSSKSEKTRKEPFENLVKQNFEDKDVDKGLRRLNRIIDGRKVLKYEYLCVLIHLGIIDWEFAYSQYHSTPHRDNYFKQKSAITRVFSQIKGLYEEQ